VKTGRASDLLWKIAAVNYISHITKQPLDQIVKQRYSDDERVDACCKGYMVGKAASAPAMTTVVGWAAELVQVATNDLLDQRQGISVFGSLRPMGLSLSFDGVGSIKVPRRDGHGTGATGDLRGSFVGEGDPIPVRQAKFASITMIPHKLGVISVMTREIIRASNPAIEAIVREGILEDTAFAVDQALLDNVAGSVIRPAGLMNGVTPGSGSGGGTVANITADLAAVIQPFITANATTGLVFLLNPSNVFKLQWVSTSVGVYPFRDAINANTLGGIPCIVSSHVNPANLVLIRAADFCSVNGGAEFDVSEQATLHMDDGAYPVTNAIPVGGPPLQIASGAAGAGVLATPTRSLFQTATSALRLLQELTWAMRRAGMISVVTIAW
jgi:hypothetical protein